MTIHDETTHKLARVRITDPDGTGFKAAITCEACGAFVLAREATITLRAGKPTTATIVIEMPVTDVVVDVELPA